MRYRARKDDNHRAIVKALRDAGASVADVAGIPCGFDIIAGFRGRNYVIEIKDGQKTASRRKLTDIEKRVMDSWRGQYAVVGGIDEALSVVIGGMA